MVIYSAHAESIKSIPVTKLFGRYPYRNFEPVVDTNEAFEPISALDTTSRLRVLSVDTFDDMDNDPHQMVKDPFLGRAGSISMSDKKLRFQTLMKEKRRRSSNFNDCYAFELL